MVIVVKTHPTNRHPHCRTPSFPPRCSSGLGVFMLVDSKFSIAILRGVLKCPEYLDYCDRYFRAVPAGFRICDLEQDCFLPARTGIIVADRYGAAIIREAAVNPLNASRRKTEQLRFARHAARRLLGVRDPGFEGLL